MNNDTKKVIERLKNAAGMGVKVSAVYKAAEVSPFRIKMFMAGTPYYEAIKPRVDGGANLTEKEVTSINAVLDDIKKSL